MPETVSVIRSDPDLGVGIPPERIPVAERHCRARVVEIPPGEWSGEVDGIDGSGLGLLLLSGLLCRRVVQGERYGAELLGSGDLLRPWDHVRQWSSLPTEASWTVIEPARMAVLDADFALRASRFPQLGSQLLGRVMIRSRYLAILLAIISQRRVETRLTMLFWHLADRFGRVHGEWVEIPVPLTHSLLSELIAARRPSVTTALSHLQERGVLLRNGRGWRLRGTVPPELLRAAREPLPEPVLSSASSPG
jgi:CRP-like cAMP-binding protein